MMKLTNLTDNRALTMEILKNWDYDDDLEILNQFRISSTAIYPFWNNKELHFLRYSPNDERQIETIKAEIEFIEYLKQENYPVADIVKSRNFEEIQTVNTRFGEHHATVFKRVSGTRIDRLHMTDEIICKMGNSLGQLHQLSKKYEPKHHKRISCFEQLDAMDRILKELNGPESAMLEVKILRQALHTLDKTHENFGLIHYDFELDNMFFDEKANVISVIDFDDSVYHFYAMDIIKALDNILEDSEEKEATKLAFMKGYKAANGIGDSNIDEEDIEIFRRYDNLLSYVKCFRSISEMPKEKEDWMFVFKDKIQMKLVEKSKVFGKN